MKFLHAKILQWLFTWRLAYGGILLAIDGMREMAEASGQQATEELAGTVLLRELRRTHGIDA